MQLICKKVCGKIGYIKYLQYICNCILGFVKIPVCLVKSSLVFVLVEGGCLVALKFSLLPHPHHQGQVVAIAGLITHAVVRPTRTEAPIQFFFLQQK